MKRTKLILALFIFIIISTVFLSAQEKTPDPINWRELIGFLIDFVNWNATEDAAGSTTNMAQYKITEVHRGYVSGDMEMNISITDGAMIQMVYAGFNMLRGFEIDSSEQLVKNIEIKNFPAIEQYNYVAKKAEVIVLAAKRFLVQVSIENAPDTTAAKEVAETIDLEKMADLAKK